MVPSSPRARATGPERRQVIEIELHRNDRKTHGNPGKAKGALQVHVTVDRDFKVSSWNPPVAASKRQVS